MQQIGSYTVLEELARGGQGVVYRARDPKGRMVALKLLLAHRAASEASRKRFQTEVHTLSRLQHPNVVSILATGEHEGAPWLALDYVEGESLEARLRLGPLPIHEAIRVARQLAQALSYVHGCGVWHRDLKPDNVLLRGDEALLTDFGLARDVDAATTRLTVTGAFLGTPGYWPPEQARGATAEIGAHSDVYGLGAVLYACLTGQAPVEVSSLQAYLQSVESVQAPRRLRPEVPPWLSALCMRCLAVDPDERPASAAEVARALLTAGGVVARAGRGGWRLPTAGLTLALALALVASLWLTRDTTPPALTIQAPAPGSRFMGGGTLELRGHAHDTSEPVWVLVGDVSTEVRPDGAFALSLELTTGSQVLTVIARDAAGNSASSELRIDYTRVPVWYLEQPSARRAPLPLPEGLSWGRAPGDYVNDPDGSVLRWVPPGAFLMGSEERDDELPLRRVRFASGFFLAKYETTWAQYRRFCAASGARVPANEIDMQEFGGVRFLASGEDPVFNVSWDEARAYCRWAGLRLPSEAEWEYSARGPEGRRYPWGDLEPDASRLNLGDEGAGWRWTDEVRQEYGFGPPVAWDDGFAYTAPVGSFPRGASPAGVHDLAGNVNEWVRDGYRETYADAPTDGGARDFPDAAVRVSRGGGWGESAHDARGSERTGNLPDTRSFGLGFRPARSR